MVSKSVMVLLLAVVGLGVMGCAGGKGSVEPVAEEAPAVSSEQAQVDAYIAEHGDAIQRYYDAHPEEFKTPWQARCRRLMVKKPREGASDSDRAAAEAKWARARKRILEDKEPFEVVVSEESEDIVYGSSGGDMGWLGLEFMDGGNAALVQEMQPGDVRERDAELGWMLLRLEEVREARVTPLDAVRADIARRLMAL